LKYEKSESARNEFFQSREEFGSADFGIKSPDNFRFAYLFHILSNLMVNGM